jgi:hypothetical protein
LLLDPATSYAPTLAPILNMKTYLGIIVVLSITTSCGLVTRNDRAVHNQYSNILTDEDKEIITETGELYKDIELDDPDRHVFLKGRFRILKTDQEGIFNFVEVGQWIDHSRYGNSGSYHNLEFRDTLTYDSNGNTTRRAVYDKKYGTFQLTNSWTGEIVNGSFIQQMKVYDKGLLISEYSRKIVNYLTPKSDLQKTKIPFGEEKAYRDGKLIRVKIYDTNGKIVSDEKYGR